MPGRELQRHDHPKCCHSGEDLRGAHAAFKFKLNLKFSVGSRMAVCTAAQVWQLEAGSHLQDATIILGGCEAWIRPGHWQATRACKWPGDAGLQVAST
jgi:hypothetical protein